jgi:predicted ATPase/DNA-binding CsgD family transcriptional regulator
MKDSQRNINSPNNRSAPFSSFIGRQREIVEVKRLLSSHRLVTLTGAGGSGKTRLSLQVASELLGEYEDGIWFIEFASISDPEFVPQTVASALEIKEQAGRPLLDALISHLSTRHVLFLLDNCEHLVTACAQLAETLLQKCSHLKILATSREILGITGEAAWNVPPLSLPVQRPWINPASAQETLQAYEDSESVQLFVARAQAATPDFKLSAENGAWVAEICRQLDGMPLAIELAAARIRSLSVPQIAARLNDRFHLLTGGSRTAPARQQTLAATLDWSYALLSPREQKLLQRLSVFAGGSTLDAVETVCSGEEVAPGDILDTISHLVDKSLVEVDKLDRQEIRYRLLETIRQYASERLSDSKEVNPTKDRHLHYFIEWAEKAAPHLVTANQLEWLERFEDERDNLRAALEWCTTGENKSEDGLRLAVACSRFWRLRGYLSEGRAQIAALLSITRTGEKNQVYAKALYWSASLAYLQSDYPATRVHGEESLKIWRAQHPANAVDLADTVDLLGELATEEGDYVGAPVFFEEALEIYRRLEDPRGIGDMLMQLGWAYMRMGEYNKVAPYMEEALGLFREIEHVALLGFTLAGLGELAIRQGQYERATKFLEESLAIRRQHGHKWGTGASLGSLGWIALQQKDFKRMRRYLDLSLAVRVEIGDQGGIAWCLEKLAEAKYQQSQLQEAAKIFGKAEALRIPMGSVIDPADQPHHARIITTLQSALGMEAFVAAWGAGKAMRLEDVIDLALADLSIEFRPTEKEKFGGLTEREREVALWIAQGKSNREIAEAMTVGVKTVETYVTRILNKLGFDSRVQIATWAMEKGLLKSGG